MTERRREQLAPCRCGVQPRFRAPLWERLEEFGWLALRLWSA